MIKKLKWLKKLAEKLTNEKIPDEKRSQIDVQKYESDAQNSGSNTAITPIELDVLKRSFFDYLKMQDNYN